MKYEQKSFTVPASGGSAAVCAEARTHAMPDKKGNCIRCGEPVHSCHHHGHIWLEADGSLYVRHRGRDRALVAVHCQHCSATAELQAHGKATAPPRSTL